jgi:hypothetical protein
MLLVAVVDQGVEIVLSDENDVAALAAIATVRSAELNKLLAPEARRAGAAVAALHIDFALVEKFHFWIPATKKGAASRSPVAILWGTATRRQPPAGPPK